MIADLKPYAEYKESGLPWLGQVPGHWDVSPLAGLARLRSVVNQSERQLLSVYLQRGVVRFSDVDEKRTNATSTDLSNYQAVDPGDFVLNNQQAWRGSVGVSNYSGIVSPAYLVLELSKRYLARYANILFRDQNMVSQYLACSKGVGTIQRNLYWPHLKRVGVVVPPPDEQAAIVRFLDWANGRLERAIRAKRKVIALLGEQKQAIIHRAVTRGLDPSVPLKPSGIPWLGDIPQHWEVLRVKQATRILRGKFSHRPRNDASLYDGPYPFIQTGVVAQASKFITSYSQTLNEKGLAVSKLFPSGTLVMTIAANIGEVAVLTFDACFPDSIVGFVPETSADRDYLYMVFVCMKPELLREAPVNTQGNLNVERIGAMGMPFPPLAEQGNIAKHAEVETAAFDLTISRLEREIELLREYRTRLVADVVTGKLDVREAAAKLPEESDDPERFDGADALTEGDEDTDGEALDTVAEEAEA